ncbi:MAG: Na+/H+ antiporter subunit E [Lachnospiraceae bacterium]|nr:Na+/H+ antiporter subunit E [Lachnospiraceae bacterium]
MYIILVLFWILLNGRFTIEILIFGLIIAAAVFWFTCRFLDYSVRKDLLLIRSLGMLLMYVVILLKEIFLANCQVLRFVYSPKYVSEPVIYYFKTDLKSGFARMLLANAITLTPGTITVYVHGEEFCIHALDKTLAEGIEEGGFNEILKKMEAGW